MPRPASKKEEEGSEERFHPSPILALRLTRRRRTGQLAGERASDLAAVVTVRVAPSAAPDWARPRSRRLRLRSPSTQPRKPAAPASSC